jgi:hypothetical protein
MPSPPGKFTLPRVLICEGEEDKAFFERLTQARSLPDFHISTTAGTRGAAGGNTKFGSALRSLKFRNLDVIRHILLVTDADDDWDRRFIYVCDQITEAAFGRPPAKPFQPSASRPPITVMMIPVDLTVGCLECVCEIPARHADNAMGGIIDDFIVLAGKDQPKSGG